MIMALLGGSVLLPDGTTEHTEIVFGDAGIERVGGSVGRAAALDVRGFLVLPGLVDLHGDAFERQIMPRPKVSFDHRIALRDTDRQLVANGITTAYHALTYSWEPGLRGRDAALALIGALGELGPSLACDTRLHLRHEAYNVDAVDEIGGWIERGQVDLLAFNDHVADIEEKCRDDAGVAAYADRTGLSTRDFRALLARTMARASEVSGANARLAAMAREAGLPMASHDDETPLMRAHFHDLGARLCEFPLDAPTAQAARRFGNAVIMGAPNIVRGGSHAKRFSAHEAWRAGLCSIFASDYYYPALLHAAFKLVRDGEATLADVWRAVSTTPAQAVGLSDRGSIREGLRADLVLIDPSDPEAPRVAATIANGQLAYVADPRLALAGARALAYA